MGVGAALGESDRERSELVTDPMTAYLRALVEAIDADEAASEAHGRDNAARAYDRRELAESNLRRALGGLMADRKVVADALAWREAVVAAERASALTMSLRERGSTNHRELYEAKDKARSAESLALWDMRNDVTARMGDGR